MPQPIKIQARSENGAGVPFDAVGGQITVGRDLANTLPIDSTSVSRYHGHISEAGSQWLYWDLGSTNGSWINGVSISSGKARILRTGDALQLADTSLKIQPADDSSLEAASLNVIGNPALPPRSVLVVTSDQFVAEYPLSAIGMAFRVAVADAELICDTMPELGVVQVCCTDSNRLELLTYETGGAVLLNGAVPAGTTMLSDRDEIVVGDFRILVNDISTSVTNPERTPDSYGLVVNVSPVSSSRSERTSDLQDDSLERERFLAQERKRRVEETRYAFSSHALSSDVTDTQEFKAQKRGRKPSEIAAIRFAGMNETAEEGLISRLSDTQLVAIGAVVLLTLVGGLMFIVSMI